MLGIVKNINRTVRSSSGSINLLRRFSSHPQDHSINILQQQQEELQRQQRQRVADELLPKGEVTFNHIVEAYHRIKHGIKRTPLTYSDQFSELAGCDIYLKKDFMQHSGSFKERGGRNALMVLTPEERKIGVIAASAGNHALALAYHGKLLNIPVTCVMPVNAPLTKIDRCRKFGANVILHGNHIGEAKAFAQKEYPDKKYINGYDDPEIIAGAGSIVLEIVEQLDEMKVSLSEISKIIVPVGGAGLIAGVSLAIKKINPNIKVIGVEPENIASFTAALKAGQPTNGFIASSVADGLAVPVVGPTSFAHARNLVDEVVLVSEKEISTTMMKLIEMEKFVVEGGGAAAIAALLPPTGKLYLENISETNELSDSHITSSTNADKVIVLLTGGNVDVVTLNRVMERALAAEKRLVRFRVVISDRPGGVAALCQEVAQVGISIKDLFHERAWLFTRTDQVVVQLIVETTGQEHSEKMFNHLTEKGYQVIHEP